MTEQAVDVVIPTETCTHDPKKMLIYGTISFVSGFFLSFGSYANFELFAMVVSFCCFLCKRDFLNGKNEI